MEFGKLDKGGFSFDLCSRNQWLETKGGYKQPVTRKTGTTIVGLVCKDAVILGADTRATEGDLVCDKNCEKIHYIASNIYCCGAGTSADTENSTALISSQLELHRLSTGRQPRVVTAMTLLKSMLFRYQGHVSAALILGGVDITGPHLYTIYPHGSVDKLSYGTMGSGSYGAMGVFEAGYRPDMEIEEGKELVRQAISSGIYNDLGSGGNIDLMVITKDKTEMFRNDVKPNERKFRRAQPYFFPTGHTPILKDLVTIHDVVHPNH